MGDSCSYVASTRSMILEHTVLCRDPYYLVVRVLQLYDVRHIVQKFFVFPPQFLKYLSQYSHSINIFLVSVVHCDLIKVHDIWDFYFQK